MLEAVGHPFAVNPDRALRRAAEENGWPVLEFRRPVALTSPLRLDTPVGKILVSAAGVGALAGAVVAAVLVSGRRSRSSA